MSEVLILGMVRNAGMSFSDKTNENLIKMYKYCEQVDEYVDYVDFQIRIEDYCKVTKSNVRMYSPFFFYQGLINQYKGTRFKVNEYFTDLGKAYAKSLIVARATDNEKVLKKAKKISKDILSCGMYTRKKMNQCDYYFDFLEMCLSYGKTNIVEFNYMVYCKEVICAEDYVSTCANMINELRNGEKELIFKQDRVSKTGENVREIFPDNTYNYTRNLLVECGLIEEQNGTCCIPADKVEIVKDLLNKE